MKKHLQVHCKKASEIFINKAIGLFVLTCFLMSNAMAQSTFNLGPVNDVLRKIENSKSGSEKLTLPTSDKAHRVLITSFSESGDFELLTGSVIGKQQSLVYLYYQEGNLFGQAIIKAEGISYKYSTNENGDVIVESQSIDKSICNEYHKKEEASVKNKRVKATHARVSTSSASVPVLQSLPGAPAVVLLDFDGEYVINTPWNYDAAVDTAGPIIAAPSGFTEAEIIEIWEQISEDYRPFNLNITTDTTVFNATPGYRRQRCIFTPTNTFPHAQPGLGGIAFQSTLYSPPSMPCWVFESTPGNAGVAGAHEIGHTLGLSHDGRTIPEEDYYYGTSEWAPIMGVGYNSNLVQWSKGEYANANNLEDDIDIIANTPFIDSTAGIGFRPDEAGDTAATAKALALFASGVVNESQNIGIISQRTDIDCYSFYTSGGNITIHVNNTSDYENLDVLLTLKNSSGSIVTTADPQDSLNATISDSVSAGTYYLFVDGTGKGNPATGGYSDYASLGEYSVSGSIPQPNTPPSVSITSPSDSTVFTAPASFTVTASTSDLEGPIDKVEFYLDTTMIGEDEYYPSFNTYISDLEAGTYVLTAKAFDEQGLSTTSDPVTITVSSTSCLLDEPIPDESEFIVRNNWGDQNAGSGVTNESGALKVTHRAWGQSELWVLQNGNTFSVSNGEVYNVKLDYKDFASIGLTGMEIGFATGINSSNNGPVLSGSTTAFPSGFSSANFTTKSVNLTAASSGQVFLAIKLEWAGQPSAQVVSYIKNLIVCEGAGQTSKISLEDLTTVAKPSVKLIVAPNPSNADFSVKAKRDIEELTVISNLGKVVYKKENISNGMSANFGNNLHAGMYLLKVTFRDGSKEMHRIIKKD